jgi:ABC-type sugar transport system permease subunit
MLGLKTNIDKRLRVTDQPWILPVTMVWQLVVAAGSAAMALSLFQRDDFYNLGDTVQYFMSGVALLPGVLALVSMVLLFFRHPNGRYISLVINYVGMVLAAAYALHDNWFWLLAFLLAYGLYTQSERFGEDSIWRQVMRRGAWASILLFLLLVADATNSLTYISDQYRQLETWLATGAILVFAFVGYRMLLLGRYFGESTDQQAAWQGWLMLSPNLIGFMIFFAGPLLLSFYFSFTDSTGVHPPGFVGLNNYRDALGIQFKTMDTDGGNPQAVLDHGYIVLDTVKVGSTRVVIGATDTLFWRSLKNTLVYCLVLVPMSVIPAILLAIILNSKIPGMKFFRAVYFLPSVAAVVGTALIWRWLYNVETGYINYAIGQVVEFINSVFGTSMDKPKTQWLTDDNVMLFSVITLSAWQTIGFNTVLFLAGLQGIPHILYEAAYVDGAGRWGQFRNVTLPLLAPTTFFVVVTTIITGLQVFNEPYALIAQRPMPTAATTSVYYLYTRGFFSFEFGYASAVAWLVFALIFAVTIIQFRVSRGGAYD